MNDSSKLMSDAENEAPTPAPARPAAPVQAPVEATSTVSARLLRVLPRVFLLLVLVGIVWIFRQVLLPFALAVFLAYLLFPVIAILENGHVARWRWRMPRWTAVIITYTVLFFVGYQTLPRVAVSLAAEMGSLREQVPSLFASFGKWQEDLNQKIVKLLEVESIPNDAMTSIQDDLEDLQKGTLERSATATQFVDSMPIPAATESTEPGNEPAPPTRISLISIEVNWNGRSRESNGAPPPVDSANLLLEEDRPEDALAAAGLENSQDEDGGAPPDGETEADGEGTDAVEPLFSDEARQQVRRRLQEFLNEQLGEQGLARPGLPAETVRFFLQLNKEVLGLPEDHPSLRAFQERLSEYVRNAIREEQYAEIVRQEMAKSIGLARGWATDQLKKSTVFVTAVVTGTFEFFLILMLTAFFLVFFSRVRDYLRDLVPPGYRDDYTAVLKRIDTRLSGAIRGQVIICIVNGCLTYPGLVFIGHMFEVPVLRQFALLLSVVAGILSLIPIFGVIISTVPMVLLAMTQSFAGALAVIAWISIIHAIEAYILNPHILGHSAQMNPIIVVFALLAGQQTAGLVGALLAVPIASVVVAMFGYYRRRMARVYAAESGVEATEDTWGD